MNTEPQPLPAGADEQTLPAGVYFTGRTQTSRQHVGMLSLQDREEREILEVHSASEHMPAGARLRPDGMFVSKRWELNPPLSVPSDPKA